MNTILTKCEREEIFQQCADADDEVVDRYGRAVEAAVLAKLAQQADRQRVRDEPDWRHPRIQALIGADARNRICIDLVWRILENPRREFTAGDMEYWDKLHDKVREVALAAAPEAPAQADDDHLEQHLEMAPAQASAVDERDRKDAERYRWLSKQMLGVDFDWDESGKTALCFEMPDGCSFAADCDQVIDDASAALAQKGGR